MFQLWINANVTDAMRAQMGKDGQWKHESVPPPPPHPPNILLVLLQQLNCCRSRLSVALNSLLLKKKKLKRASLSTDPPDVGFPDSSSVSWLMCGSTVSMLR